MFSSKRALIRLIAMFAVLALFASGCGGDAADSAQQTDENGNALPVATVVIDPSQANLPTAEELAAELEQLPTPEPLPTVDPALFATPIPSPTPEAPVDPWEVHVLIAKSDTVNVPVFDAPEGEAFDLRYEYLDGSTVAYPLQNPTYFDNDLALMVVDGGGEPGDDWAEVLLPIRPNGTTAWVQTGFFDWSTHNYHIDINVTDNWVQVFEGDELIVETGAISGRPDRPTPVLEAYIDEKVEGPNAAYGPWILSIAAFSNSMSTFSSGLPKLALHGTNEPDKMGQYISSGCVRVENDIITLIAETVPVGTAVRIFS